MINELKVYAVKHKSEETRSASRSGGIFTAISDWILEDGGYVYGCVLTEDNEAVHVRATTQDERNQMRGSKYIQSDLREVFKEVLEDLKTQKKVLFSGTSCQIAGLKTFLGKEFENLYCIDIVCHGVPSPLVWKKYVEWQENRTGKKCLEADFRNKKEFGWASHVETLLMEKNKKIHSGVFRNLFYSHVILRPACYKCPYKDITHPGDITIADYWGIDEAAPGFNDNKGVSLVLINNAKGSRLFDAIQTEIDYASTRIEDSMQQPLIAPFEAPGNRTEFWEDFAGKSFAYVAKKYGSAGIKQDIKIALSLTKKRLKRLIKG